MVPFACPKRNQKGTRECGSEERLRAAGVPSRHPWTPSYGGESLWCASCFRRAKSRPVSVLLSAHRGLLPSKIKDFWLLTWTAWCLPTCLVRRWSVGPAAQFCLGRRCSYHADTSKFHTEKGPVPRGKKGVPFRFCPPDECSQENRRASPVNGVRGKPPMSAASGMALIEGGPGDSLVTF